ncbi:MAG: DUF1385 domain-containing protein [Clostridia bacterium]|nr:DUF1385 domain-containing protein [Clostridia bacterium]
MANKYKKGLAVPERLGKVGGQAVLEGVMMKAGERTVTTCRKEDGSIYVDDSTFVSVRKKHKILNIPILRGVVNFVEMMILSTKTLTASADALEIEDEEGKCEKWLKKHLGVRLTDIIMLIGTVLGLALAVTLFMFVPNLVSGLIDKHLAGGKLGVWVAVIEGGVKIIIFLLYLWLVSLIPDIKRTFMYHGAEHKSIACFEAGAPLTPESAKEYTRFHPRCGTSFMFFMIALGVVAGLLIKLFLDDLNPLAYTGIRLLILPVVVGLGYEFILIAGKHDNFITRFFSAPGLWVQRITTKEPTEDMLEIAIISIKCALRDSFPEFMEFYKNREWEKKPEPIAEGEGTATAEPSEEANLSANAEQQADEASAQPISAHEQPSEPTSATQPEPKDAASDSFDRENE